MANREVVSDVFSMLLEDKRNALEVYNSLNDKTYDDPELVEICTLDRGISLSIKNDASFIIAADLNMYEHQSTYNPNMPLRYLLYLTEVIKPIIKDKDLYGHKLIKIPAPRFVTFYNGISPRPEKEIFKLSTAYENKHEEPELELKVICYNINAGNNTDLLSRCSILKEYMFFVDMVREFKSDTSIENPIKEAIDYCIKKNILKVFLTTRGDEVQKAMVIDMTFEAREKLIKRDYYDDGFNAGFNDGFNDGSKKEKLSIAQNMIKENIPTETIRTVTGLTMTELETLSKNISGN